MNKDIYEIFEIYTEENNFSKTSTDSGEESNKNIDTFKDYLASNFDLLSDFTNISADQSIWILL